MPKTHEGICCSFNIKECVIVTNFTNFGGPSLVVPTAPQSLRVMAKSTSQIKVTWNPPEASNGVLKGYQVVVKG